VVSSAAAAGARHGALAAGSRPHRSNTGNWYDQHPHASILPSAGQHGNGLHATQRREKASEKATKWRRQQEGETTEVPKTAALQVIQCVYIGIFLSTLTRSTAILNLVLNLVYRLARNSS
jgi:hypothetical protein